MRLPLIARSDLIRAASSSRGHAGWHREKLPGISSPSPREWRADRALESVAARTEVRKADLGAHECALRLPLPSKTGSRGRDPSHRREISSVCQIYAHVCSAVMSDDKIATIVAGQRPTDLTPGGDRLRRRLHAGRSWRAAGAELPSSRPDVRPTRRSGTHLFGWALLPCVRHAKWVRRAGTGAERGLIGFGRLT